MADFTSTLEAALAYHELGWQPVPLAHRDKMPFIKGWTSVDTTTPEEVQMTFADPESNIGVVLGERSGGLVDVDLDTPEACQLAPVFLPATGARFGRPSARGSHWLYICDGATTTRYRGPDRAVLLELRSTGAQTMVPPSTHPSGEAVAWENNGDPARVEDLGEHLGRLAAATLLARAWPERGSRNDAAMHLSGALLRNGWSVDDTSGFVYHVAHAAGDEEARQRASAVTGTDRSLKDGKQVTGWPSLAKLLGDDVVSRVQEWLGINSTAPPPDADGEDEADDWTSKIISLCIELKVELFHAGEGVDSAPFASIFNDGHLETWSTSSPSLRRWLTSVCLREFGRVPSKTTFDSILETLGAKALFDGPRRQVGLRVAEADGSIYLDLANASWEVVRISPAPDGVPCWEVIEATEAPLRFRRTGGMLALPTPVKGGSLEELRPLLNLTDEDWTLVKGYLLMALHPRGDYPVLLVTGERGSAKSILCEILRSLIDPNRAPLRSPPKNEQDLVLAANNGWVVGLENISEIRQWLSDALCRISTGGGFSTRTFYQLEDETIFQVRRMVLINGINNVATQGDLASRTVVLTLPRIPDDELKDKEALLAEVERLRPKVLGSLLDAASVALANKDEVRLDRKTRLTDFCTWATAGEQTLGIERGAFMRTYLARAESMSEDVVEASPIGPPLLELLDKDPIWEGTASALLGALEAIVLEQRPKDWPKTAVSVAHMIRRLAPALRSRDILVEVPAPGANPRNYRFERLAGGSEHDRGDRGAAENDQEGAEKAGAGPRSPAMLPRLDDQEPRANGAPDSTGNGDSRGSAASAALPQHPDAQLQVLMETFDAELVEDDEGPEEHIPFTPSLFPPSLQDFVALGRTAQDRPCFLCGGTSHWRPPHGQWTCERCHPSPYPEDEIERSEVPA